MSGTPHEPRRLTAWAAALRTELERAATDGDDARAGNLRGELALLEDLALPEAVCELRLQRITFLAAQQAMTRAVPPALTRFLA